MKTRQGHNNLRLENSHDVNPFRLMERDVIGIAKEGTRCLYYTLIILNKSGRKRNGEGVAQGNCENARSLVRLRYCACITFKIMFKMHALNSAHHAINCVLSHCASSSVAVEYRSSPTESMNEYVTLLNMSKSEQA